MRSLDDPHPHPRRSFAETRPSHRTLARLKRVEASLAQWEAYEQNGGTGEHPSLSREALRSLRATLREVLREQLARERETVAERRN